MATGALVTYFWPPDPQDQSWLRNLNLGPTICVHLTLCSLLVLAEGTALFFVIRKIRARLQSHPPRNKILQALRLDQHIFKYAGLTLVALFSLPIVKHFQVSGSPPDLRPQDDPTQARYLEAYVLILAGDKAASLENPEEARRQYQKAYEALLEIQKHHPEFEPTIIQFRLRYLREKLPPAGAAG